MLMLSSREASPFNTVSNRNTLAHKEPCYNTLTSKRLFGSLRKPLFLHQSAFHVFARNGVGVYRWRCLQSRISGVDKESIWLNGQAEMRTIFTVQEVP